jgi:Abortive infection C-terminus
MTELTKGEIIRLVNAYIGVSGGYLGDFSYRTHAEFYTEFCEIDVEPDTYDGTTRERFVAILERSDSATQAKILRGVLLKYPPGTTENRTTEQASKIENLIRRLESGCGVTGSTPAISSDIVTRAINDAEALLRTTGATSGVDRMHTAFHGFLRALCEQVGIVCTSDASITVLYKNIREKHPRLNNLGSHADHVDRILKSFASAVDSLNTLRNHASIAHPNSVLLEREEAYLYINAVRTLMAYIDAKASETTSNKVLKNDVKNART